MSTTARRPGSDATAAPVPFSYAQAAKGLSNSGPPTAAPSKPASGTITPSKDANHVPTAPPVASVASWADDAEAEDSKGDKSSSTRDVRARVPPAVTKLATADAPVTISAGSSPDLGASSSSTAVKDDDACSLQNATSDSTWENRSQASTSVDKTAEPAEKTSEQARGKNLEKVPPKPLQESLPPVVNPWTRRADELKAKAAQKPSTPKSTPNAQPAPISNGVTQGSAATTAKKARASTAADTPESKENRLTDSKAKPREEEKATLPRKESRQDVDADKPRKGNKGRSQEKEPKPAPAALPLPPNRDEESWPTPETVLDEDRKKTQERAEKTEKDRKESASSRTHGKQEWVTVPYTPNVIFNTPLPSTASGRRGGRGGGRGGAQGGGRNNSLATNGAGNSEKDALASTGLSNGDQLKRGRPDAPVARGTSPKEERAGSAGSMTLKEGKSPAPAGDKPTRSATAPETEVPQHRSSATTDATPAPAMGGQNNTFSRQNLSNRQSKGRRGDLSGTGERRKNSELMSPTRETASSYDRQVSNANQTEALDPVDRRASILNDGQFVPSKSNPNERRAFGSFSGRERGRGGGRTSRGGYQNGHHQYSNGHAPQLHSSSTFPLAHTPPTFQPDQSNYFVPPPAQGRYRNGHRSQSVTTDSMYGRNSAYSAGHQQIPPAQNFNMGAMYDYPIMQPPLSAAPFNPYAVDHYTIESMVSTQMEYYFSVENLCKDIFLRKHMDSQGFVFLSVIADFNRIKQLTTNMDIIKHICYTSNTIEFVIGSDGKDRLRRRKGWEQWVLNKSERDPSAQNDGPEELHLPPIPYPTGLEQADGARYPEMPASPPSGSAPYLPAYGVPAGGVQDTVHSAEGAPNGHAPEGVNGHSINTQAVSGESDSFFDDQIETLSVIVRKQDYPQKPSLHPAAFRTFSNGSFDSRNGVPDESEKVNGLVSGTPPQGVERDMSRTTMSPLSPSSASPASPVRLYWVKGKDAPVESLPRDSAYEFYTHLRSKALEQRHNSVPGHCPYDMDVLYQFWSHFLIRNFNTQMYNEFRQFAFEDFARSMSDVGISNLIKYYGEALLSSRNLIRSRVARHFVELVRTENEDRGPAFKQLRSALRNGAIDPGNRKRIGDFLDDELRASLE